MLTITSILVILLAVGSAYYYMQKQWMTFSDEQSRITFVYPKIVTPQELSQEDEADHIIFRGMTQSQKEKSFFITVRYEENLRSIAAHANTDLLTVLMNNADTVLPERFEGYQKISSQVVTTDPSPAGEVLFSYIGPSGESVTQRLYILLQDDNTAFYIAAQTPTRDFEKVNTRYFEKMFESATFQY